MTPKTLQTPAQASAKWLPCLWPTLPVCAIDSDCSDGGLCTKERLSGVHLRQDRLSVLLQTGLLAPLTWLKLL